MDAGVDVALTCDYPGLPIETLRVAAAMAMQYGLDERRALAAITEIPAKFLVSTNASAKSKKATMAIWHFSPGTRSTSDQN